MELLYAVLILVGILLIVFLVVPFIEPAVDVVLQPWLRYCARVDRWNNARRRSGRVDNGDRLP
jgi:hypothetical protein